MRWIDDRAFQDEGGVVFQYPEDWPQYDMVARPLAEATVADLDGYPWPDVEDATRYAGFRDETRVLHENPEYAVCATAIDTVIFD